MADISFNIAFKELKIAQIAQLNQLFQLLHLVHIYGHGFYESSRVLMRKNVNNDVSKDSPIERFRITLTANGRNDHVTMFILYLPLAVFSFSVKLSSFSLASKARIILHYSNQCTNCFKKT